MPRTTHRKMGRGKTRISVVNKTPTTCYWPGPTRLYDEFVGCGAVLMTDEIAREVLTAIEHRHSALYGVSKLSQQRLATAAEMFRFTFGIKE